MNVLLVYPSHGRFEVAPSVQMSIGAFIPPLGLLYLAKMIELAGHHVKVIDCSAEQQPMEAIQRSLNDMDVVGTTVYSGPRDYAFSLQISQLIKEHDPDLPLVLGGPHCSLFPQQTLEEHHADVNVQGEAEDRIIPILNALQGRQPFSIIPGITYRDNGQIHITPLSEHQQDLDALPFPSRHLVKHYTYGHSFGVKVVPGIVTSMMSSRGCPFHCRFCQQSAFTPRFQSHSVPRIIQEIDDIVHNGYTSIVFADDDFLWNKKQTEMIMDHIISEDYDLTLWIANARVDSADKNLYRKLRNAGVEHIIFGIESGSQEMLDFYHKRISLDQIRQAVTLSHDMGFFTSGNFIIGGPIETKNHIQETIDFARSLPLDNAFFKELMYAAKSPLWNEAVAQGKINPDEAMVLADCQRDLGLFNPQELQRFCDSAFNAFTMNPRYWLRELGFVLRHRKFRFLHLGLRLLLKQRTSA